MPKAADAGDIGRPVPKNLEIEVLRKFMKFDSQYADDKKREYPHLRKPPPGLGASGSGGVEWVGLNVDPCKAKYLAKCGIVRPDAAMGLEEPPQALLKKSFSLSGYLNTDPLPYPHWQGDLHGPFTRPPSVAKSRSSSYVPSLVDDAKSQCTRRTSLHSTVVTKASVAKAVSQEVQRQLQGMSCHEHYLEQKLLPNVAPSCVKPAPTPADLNELLYFGVSAELQGRHSYLHKRHRIMPQERSRTLDGKIGKPNTSAGEVGWLAFQGKGKWVGKMCEPAKPPPDTLEIC